MISATALKASQCRAHSAQLRFRPPHQRIKQTSALAEREKQKMQLSHSLAEPRPPGIALRSRSKTANGPCSFAIRWLSLKVASDPRTKMNQRTLCSPPNGYLAALMFTTDIANKRAEKKACHSAQLMRMPYFQFPVINDLIVES